MQSYALMKRPIALASIVLAALALLNSRPSTVQAAPKADDNFELVKVAEGVYAAIAKPGGLASGNAGFVIGDDGVLIFDTFLTPAAVAELIEVIESQNQTSH